MLVVKSTLGRRVPQALLWKTKFPLLVFRCRADLKGKRGVSFQKGPGTFWSSRMPRLLSQTQRQHWM